MKYNICVPIPIKSASIRENKHILDKVAQKSPDFIELRFDYIENVQVLSLKFIKDLKRIIPSNILVIFTFRDSSEGGKIKIPQKQRLNILKMFIEAKPDYIDIEMNTDQDFLYEFIDLLSQKGVNIVLSYHNFEKTDELDETINRIVNFNDKLIQNVSLNTKHNQKIIYKIIFTAQTFKDNLIPLKLYKHFSNLPHKLISFCMGTLGIFSRVICVTVGSFLTYASLEEKTAPGQLTIEEMREIYNLFST